MSYQNISASLTPEDKQAVYDSIKAIQERLPFLISLTVEERKRLFKMGDKRLSFVRASLNGAKSNPDILPRSFDINEFEQDYQLVSDLTEIVLRLRQLLEQIDDTAIAVGSEALTSSLEFYEYAKTAQKRTPGLKAVIEELSAQFKNARTSIPDATVAVLEEV